MMTVDFIVAGAGIGAFAVARRLAEKAARCGLSGLFADSLVMMICH